MPHSVLPVPAQRPLRGSSPGATRRVHGPAADRRVAVVLQRVDQHAVLGDVAVDVARRVQRASGETLTLRFLSSQPTTGAITRLWVSARRSPVAQASYAASASWSGCDLAQRAAQVGVAVEQVLAVRRVLLGHRLHGRDVDQVDRQRRLDGVAGADGLGEVVAGVEEDHVDARARPWTARCASTASPIEEVIAEAVAERRDGPLDDVPRPARARARRRRGRRARAARLGAAARGAGCP